MRGDKAVIDVLNDVLTAELTGINQYFIHAKMLESWGYTKLAAKVRAESIDEMHDADRVIERLLFLGGLPNLQRLNPLSVGENPLEQLHADHKLEQDAIELYKKAIAIAIDAKDFGTRELLERHLIGEESHADWLEAQLVVIDQIGIENYLAQQLSD